MCEAGELCEVKRGECFLGRAVVCVCVCVEECYWFLV